MRVMKDVPSPEQQQQQQQQQPAAGGASLWNLHSLFFPTRTVWPNNTPLTHMTLDVFLLNILQTHQRSARKFQSGHTGAATRSAGIGESPTPTPAPAAPCLSCTTPPSRRGHQHRPGDESEARRSPNKPNTRSLQPKT
ncbi:unnamed protein product [Pleuronectes platessa]|uniref:Uncharacterized protein n=1 Tax=Pleuronectes platessa TaxID=8262 RepID=A0A9N7VEG1_PLEPL|nr:unnamed protein product [Pleuronectes platessa]